MGMPARRISLVLLLCASTAYAQGEIDMDEDPEPAPTEEAAPVPAPEENQPVVKDPKVAKKWQRAADQLVRKGDQLTKQGKATEAKTQYDNAVIAYTKAIEASDDVSLNYQLAIAEDKAGNTADAMKHMNVVLAAQGIKPDVMKKAQTKLDEMSMKVGVLMLTIDPEGTQISVGGQVVGEAPLKEPLVLAPGTVMLSLTAVGYQPKDVELKIEAGSESERKLTLEPVPVVIKEVVKDEPEPEKPEEPKAPPKLPLYIGAGVTGALVITATITGIVAVSYHSTYTDPLATGTDRINAQAAGRTMATVTDICLVGGVAAAGFTTYWYLKKYKPAQTAMAERQTQAKVDVVPWVQPQAGGLVAVGSF